MEANVKTNAVVKKTTTQIKRWFVAAVAAAALVSLDALDASNAWAQQGVINLDETVIKGRIQKPEAFYILQHANLNYEKLTPKQSFLEELLKTVEQDPF